MKPTCMFIKKLDFHSSLIDDRMTEKQEKNEVFLRSTSMWTQLRTLLLAH